MSIYSEAKNRIKGKIREQEGATLLLALLFFLLCAVCGSVILASATTSSGRIAGLGKNRQNYQSVEAAARLLENELNSTSVVLRETEKITITVEHVEKDNDGEGEDGEKSEETYTTTSYTFSGPNFLNVSVGKTGTNSSTTGVYDSDDETTGSDATDSTAAAFSVDNGRNTGLSMLEQLLTDTNLSSYKAKGEAYQNAGSIAISDKENETSDDAEDNLAACQQAWASAFLTGDAGKSIKRHFTLQLSDIEAENSGSIAADSLVDAELQLYGDGTLEIRLSNGGETTDDSDGEGADKNSADADKYYMLLRGMAEVKTQSRSERRTADGDDADSDEGSETLITKKTTITWGDFVITKNAAEAGTQKEAENGTKA